VPATTTDRSDEGHAEAAGSVESHIGSPPPSLLVLHPGAPQRHSQIRRSRLSVRTGPAGLPSRSKLRSVLRARPWSYKVGCAVWLPDWLPVPRSFLLIRRAGLMLGEASVTVHLRRELCRPVRRRPVMSRPRCCHGSDLFGWGASIVSVCSVGSWCWSMSARSRRVSASCSAVPGLA
jgi:hypothetical protein